MQCQSTNTHEQRKCTCARLNYMNRWVKYKSHIDGLTKTNGETKYVFDVQQKGPSAPWLFRVLGRQNTKHHYSTKQSPICGMSCSLFCYLFRKGFASKFTAHKHQPEGVQQATKIRMLQSYFEPHRAMGINAQADRCITVTYHLRWSNQCH